MATHFSATTEGDKNWISAEQAARISGVHVPEAGVSLEELAAEMKTTPAELADMVRGLGSKPKPRHWTLPSKNTLIVLAFISLGVWTVHFASEARMYGQMFNHATSYGGYAPSGLVVIRPPANFAIRLDSFQNVPSLYIEGSSYDGILTPEFLRANKTKLIDELSASIREQIDHTRSLDIQHVRLMAGQSGWIDLDLPPSRTYDPYSSEADRVIRRALYDIWPQLLDKAPRLG